MTLKTFLHNEEVLGVLKDIEHADYIWMPRIHQYIELVD